MLSAEGFPFPPSLACSIRTSFSIVEGFHFSFTGSTCCYHFASPLHPSIAIGIGFFQSMQQAQLFPFLHLPMLTNICYHWGAECSIYMIDTPPGLVDTLPELAMPNLLTSFRIDVKSSLNAYPSNFLRESLGHMIDVTQTGCLVTQMHLLSYIWSGGMAYFSPERLL